MTTIRQAVDKTQRQMAYQGVPEWINTVRIAQLTQQFLDGPSAAGTNWGSLLDSLDLQELQG